MSEDKVHSLAWRKSLLVWKNILNVIMEITDQYAGVQRIHSRPRSSVLKISIGDQSDPVKRNKSRIMDIALLYFLKQRSLLGEITDFTLRNCLRAQFSQGISWQALLKFI